MPSVQSPSLILVTGANGYLGTYVVKYLLDHGFSVRGTVRSASKGQYLQNLFAAHGEKFHYIVVQDVNLPGAYDQAVVGVTGIIHVSAAMPQAVKDVDEILKPNVDGTIALLESAKKFGTGVQRIVLTSSIAALMENKEGHYRYSEADWNESAVHTLRADGLGAGPMFLYAASKTLQEKAAWEFVENNKTELSFDLVALNVGTIFGPPLNESTTPSGSLVFIHEALTGKPSSLGFEPSEMVDVRDVAELHVQSLLRVEAAGERFVVSGHSLSYQDLLDVVHTTSPSAVGVPKGTPGSGKTKDYEKTFDNTKSRHAFNFEYRSAEESLRDTWHAFVEKGWAQV